MDNFEKYYRENLLETKRKVKASVTKDLLIIQTIRSLEELEKVSNTLTKRLREWYELYLPEFSKRTFSHEKLINTLLTMDKKEILKEMGLSKEESMGADLHRMDVAPVMQLAKKVKALYDLKAFEEAYLGKIMEETCPNVTLVAGATVGARLIAQAGSLKHLAELPSSTIQLLGAEKALFRHLRNKKNLSPKYGIIHEHQAVQQAKMKERGKKARQLAAKISIAARVDYFGKKR